MRVFCLPELCPNISTSPFSLTNQPLADKTAYAAQMGSLILLPLC